MLNKEQKDGRIFISYRRSDAKGYAGRLSDSLEDYFGNNRVFRDIEDIKGGAAFGEVIEKNIQSADAVIVLIGPTWLSVTGKDNTPRLLAPGDWVAQEIASAIDLGIPLFPVLIEQTPMPRMEELPEKLYPILQYNAITLSDNNWNADVLRLGKVLSFDIPSENERKVNFVKRAASISIFTTLAFTSVCLFRNFFKLYEHYNNLFEVWEAGVPFSELLDIKKEWIKKYNIDIALNKDGTIIMQNFDLLELWQSGIPYIGIGASCLLIFYILPLIDKERQKYLYGSIYTGALGSFIMVVLLLLFVYRSEEAMWAYVGSVIIATGMLSFMNMSGFKVK